MYKHHGSAQVDIHNIHLDAAPRAALEVARSDSVALMDISIASGHGAGLVVDGSKHVYVGSCTVAGAGTALLIQASAGEAQAPAPFALVLLPAGFSEGVSLPLPSVTFCIFSFSAFI